MRAPALFFVPWPCRVDFLGGFVVALEPNVGPLWAPEGSCAVPNRSRVRVCRACGQKFQTRRMVEYCGDMCRTKAMGRRTTPEVGMSGAQAEAHLARVIAMECAPPWVRHPVPQSGLRVGGARR